MNRNRRDISILQKIVRHCDDIADAKTMFGDNLKSLESNVHYKNSVLMSLLQIGELTTHLSDELKEAHSEIPWRRIKSMRNFAAHEYENFNLVYLLEAINDNAPALRDYCGKIIQQNRNA
jgi:uncharacterized protein with HEPN domain